MDYQKFVDGIDASASVFSFDKLPDGERKWGCLGVILAIVAIVLLIMLALGLFAAVLGAETSVSGGSVAMTCSFLIR